MAAQQKSIDELQLSRRETIEGLVKAIELHDFPTGEHVERMAAIAAFLGAELGLDPERVQLLRVAAPMHDVGKIGVPAEILRKLGCPHVRGAHRYGAPYGGRPRDLRRL